MLFRSYLAIESTPTKPAPDFERYAIPIVPLMIGLAYCGLARVWSSCSSVVSRCLTSALVILTLVVPLGDTLALDYYLTRDTRAEAAKWLSARPGLAFFEIHSGTHWDVWSVPQSTVAQDRAAGIAYLVTSSFCYDRYFRGSRLEYQPPEVYQIHAQYVKLFTYPYVEFRPRYRDFAFTNPVIRIIDIRQSKVVPPKQ